MPPSALQARVWPNFAWNDLVTPTTWTHWATGQPDGQFCAGGTAMPSTTDGAWAWEDKDCDVTAAFICEVLREWPTL